MKEIYVKENETIKQGQIIGTLGKSGRATGPHLDVRLNCVMLNSFNWACHFACVATDANLRIDQMLL